ncbi:MAG: putative porin [Chthoniobacterales bacterium]
MWLDRGFLKYELGGVPARDFAVTVGRFDNPFFGTSELIWDEDLGFDGIAVQVRYEVARGLRPFLNAGAFPVFNTDFNFSSNRPDKFNSYDKYLYGGQLGTEWTINKDWDLKVAGAYYYFQNVEGRLSSPFTPLTSADAGNTDDSRPSFAQKGNTYFPIRDIVPTVDNNFGTTRQFQYFGLATPFRDVSVTGRIDFHHFDPVHVSVFGDFVKNVAFDRAAIERRAINNRGPDRAAGALGRFVGGDTGWVVGVRVGTPALERRWDWNAAVSYREVESDAVIDGFNDSDFGLGGTNLKGYTISASLAVASHVALSLRWLSADSIAGPTYKSDVLQLDIGAKF